MVVRLCIRQMQKRSQSSKTETQLWRLQRKGQDDFAEDGIPAAPEYTLHVLKQLTSVLAEDGSSSASKMVLLPSWAAQQIWS